ncbi:restriction endonuclease subunit S [Streptococcus mitis]|jgi:hypothetical protein|uniref:restriction endonuclease subunit S n=1 Tax=Streptococcus mitis TaxID=28037 RepID=UPI001E28918A|nr:restriction endonuclease subunit S [Streptococcus mitis]MCC0092721.1 type I restriction endonuclease subunit S [Streptococcus mitis]MDU4844434.1 restriction endonuclease subunit S [Streptococcus mitis]
MTKKPSYRFGEYTEPWEQKKLGEVAEVNPKSVVPDEFKYVDLGAVVGTEMISYRNETISTSPSRAQRLAIKGDVFYQTVRPYQKNNYLFKKDDNDYVFSTGYAQLRPSGDGCFLLSYLQTNKFVNVVLDNCTGTSYPAINSKDLSDIFISLPSLPEQTAIGSFFQDIDQLISLQQRKLEVLKEQKKTYLKLLFPAKGQTKPALRFAGFEDDWKEVKLGEVVASERKGKAKSEMIGNKSIYLDTIYLNGGEQTRVDCDCDTSKEDIIILWDGSQAGAVYYGFEGALGSTLKSYKIFGSGSFYYQQMKASQSLIFERYRTPNIPHVIKSFLDDFYIFTTSLPEQEAIASFFQDLDKAIAKQEEKVNQLKESKQTLLRKMFI